VRDGALACEAAGCALRGEAAFGDDVTAAALRPERIGVVRAAPEVKAASVNGASGVVEEAAFRGDDTMLVVRLRGGATLRVAHREEDGAPPARGDSVELAWEASAVVPLRG
jgi:putrescine transport system ATP-binding protein